ncbi:hypothetical protein [Nonomuraea dietziae]|uniref:Uncharacterized protein n=1 Tax=Nonomuraea dietziae TaxID=65515 RepID=A0A7W5V1Z4_9ACTN|nr:hypothetical protein [Nonomuraea dietziae]MBB3727349.1 hypothetical protein [Nonomuraea dietziae]
MRRIIATLVTTGVVAIGFTAVAALPSAADSVRITSVSVDGGDGTENREW